MIENKFSVRKIVYTKICRCFCPIGKAWYTNEFTVAIEPESAIPDYCEVDRFVDEAIAGETLLIEEAAQRLLDWLDTELKPRSLTVESVVHDAPHGNVSVTLRKGAEP